MFTGWTDGQTDSHMHACMYGQPKDMMPLQICDEILLAECMYSKTRYIDASLTYITLNMDLSNT